MSRWFSLLLAFGGSFVVLMVFAPQFAALQQYDFWLLLMGLQLLVSIPMLGIEMALAKRSNSTPLQGMMQLTREADVSPRWRILAWAGALLLALLACGVIQMASNLLQQQLLSNVHSSWVFASLAVLSLGLSMAPRVLLLVVTVLLSIAMLIWGQVQVTSMPWQWTDLNANEWGSAVLLLSLNSLLGVGAFWQLRIMAVKQAQQDNVQISHAQQSTSSLVLIAPIVLLQLLAVLAAAISVNQIMMLMWLILPLSVVFAAVLWQLLHQQLQQRQASLMLRSVFLVLPLLAFSQPSLQHVMLIVTAGLALLLALGYAIFTGWYMKVSHLRKALHFNNEGLYNLWRVMVRIILPFVFLSGMVILLLRLY